MAMVVVEPMLIGLVVDVETLMAESLGRRNPKTSGLGLR